MSKNVVEQILEMPSAPNVLKELNRVLEAEKKRRKAFYDQITEQEKAEFINGEIIIHSPVKKMHTDISKRLSRLIDVFVDKYNLGFVGIEKVMISLTRNDYEPDICYFNREKAEKFTPDQSLFPSPDFAVEILSKRTKNRDRGIKFEDYQEHKVEEYWIIDPKEETVEQYLIEEDAYHLKLKAKTGEIASTAIHGFKINVRSIFDKEENLKELQRILLD